MQSVLRIAVTALSAAAIAAPSSAWAASSAPHAPGSSLETGVSGVFDQDAVSFRRIVGAGARYVHVVVPWWKVAPQRQPTYWQPENPAEPAYDWSAIDASVTEATRVGLTTVLMINSAPMWAQRCVAGKPTWVPVCDPDPGALAAFATAAAHRYSGSFAGLPRVRYWQGLNEPNLSLFFNPQYEDGRAVAPELYRDLINAFYFAVKSVDPSNLVLAAGLGPIARPPWTIGPMEFARRLLCMRGRHRPRPTGGDCDGGVHFDIFDIHPYTTGGPAHKGKANDVQLGDLAKLRTLLEAADRAGRVHGRFRRTPLWITEFTWDSRPPDPGGLRMATLTRWTAEALYRAWRAGVTHFFWYPLRDELTRDMPFSQSIQGGLFFRGETIGEDRPKPHLRAFRFPFVAFSGANGFVFWGRTPNSRGGRVAIQVRQGGGWRDAAVARANRHGIFEGAVRGFYGRNQRGAVRARFRRDTAVPFSLKPVRSFHQPPFG
jgi:hypothetical protein